MSDHSYESFSLEKSIITLLNIFTPTPPAYSKKPNYSELFPDFKEASSANTKQAWRKIAANPAFLDDLWKKHEQKSTFSGAKDFNIQVAAILKRLQKHQNPANLFKIKKAFDLLIKNTKTGDSHKNLPGIVAAMANEWTTFGIKKHSEALYFSASLEDFTRILHANLTPPKVTSTLKERPADTGSLTALNAFDLLSTDGAGGFFAYHDETNLLENVAINASTPNQLYKLWTRQRILL